MGQDRRVEIRDNKFLLDIVAEVLYGCKWSCSGCAVSKETQNGFLPGDLQRLDKLVKDFKNKGYALGDVHVGPTDFMSAGNTERVLTDPEFLSFINNFNILVLGSTFLEKEETLDHWADLLSKYYANMQINLTIIMDSAQVNNAKYLTKVSFNVQRFLSRLNVDFTKQYINFNAFNYTKISKNSELTHQMVSDRMFDLFGIRPSYAFSLSRKTDKNASENKEEILETVSWLNRVFYDVVKQESFNPKLFQIALPTDWINKNYVYRNGKFYYAPIVYDPFINFDPRLEIPVKDWVPEEFEAFEETLLTSQYNNLSNKTECGTCIHLGTCVQRGTLHLMDLLNEQNCIVAKDAYNLVADRRFTC